MKDQDVEKPNLNTSLINVSLAYTAGFLTRKLIVGNSNNVYRKITGIVAEVIVANLIFNNAEFLKQKSGDVCNKVFKYNKEQQ